MKVSREKFSGGERRKYRFLDATDVSVIVPCVELLIERICTSLELTNNGEVGFA